MDRLINNESVVVCSVLDAINLDVNELPKLYVFAVLTADNAIRGRLRGYSQYDELCRKESSYYRALNRKFLEFQPVFLNAMTMLLLGGKIEKSNDGKYELTKDGVLMLWDVKDDEESVVTEVRDAVKHLNRLVEKKDVKQLYKDLKIVL